MLIFLAIAVACFIIMVGGFIFGHDHDVSHDHDMGGHDFSHDAGHDGGHDVGHGDSPTISIFSTRVIATFGMGFGAAGAIAKNYDFSYLASSGFGLLLGVVLAAIMFLVLELFYGQQASSIVKTESAVGRIGVVTVSIDEGRLGEVSLSMEEQYRTFTARSNDGKAIPKGRRARIVSVVGGQLIVEQA